MGFRQEPIRTVDNGKQLDKEDFTDTGVCVASN